VLSLSGFAALAYCGACAAKSSTDWPSVPALSAAAAQELEAACGLELEHCPALEVWLSDVDAMARALR